MLQLRHMSAVTCVSQGPQSSALGSCPVHEENPCCDPPASRRVIQQSFFHQELVPQDRAFQEQRSRCSTFHPHWTGRPLVVFTPSCLCNSHLQWCRVDIHLFIFLCCKSHLAEQPWTWALHPFLLLPLQVTSGPSCESSVSISAEFHWHRPRKEATPWRQEGNKDNSPVFQKNMQKFSMLPTLKPQGWLLLHPALRYFFWDLLHQGSGFLICKQLHLVFSEQLEWSCSYLHAEESIGSFCVAVPEEELGSRRDLEAE